MKQNWDMTLQTSSQSTRGSEHQEMESSHGSHMEADQGKLIMDEELWKDFLPDLHVEILSSFSILELCQFRTISREWNDLATYLISRAWNGIMAQLKARPQATYMFKSPKTMDLGVNSAENLARPIWEVYDPSTRQCFPLNMQFLKKEDNFGGLCRVEFASTTIAADKGFICVFLDDQLEYIKVANPMTGCVVELPPLSGVDNITDYHNQVVSLVVADNYSSFSLYVVQDHLYDTPLTLRFDSNVGVWQELPRPPATMWPTHMLHMESTLFTLFWEKGWQKSLQLFVLDTKTTRTAWRNTGVELPQEVEFPQLATALKRLFFVAFLEDRIELREVDVRAASCTVVASMDESNEFYAGRKWLDGWDGHDSHHNIVMVGCENFIVFSSVSGAAVAYDLVNSKWCEWIQSKKTVRDTDYHGKSGLYGNFMPLSILCLRCIEAFRQLVTK